MSVEVSLEVKTCQEELARIASVLEDVGARDNWPNDLLFKINLVLEEVGVNVMNHAFDDDEVHTFYVTLKSDPRAVTIEVSDSGRPFDPITETPEPNIAAPIESRAVGGVGVLLVLTMMDEVTYRRAQGMNQLTIIKHRTDTQPGSK